MVLAIKEIPYVTQRYLLVVASGSYGFSWRGYDVAMYKSYQLIIQEHTTPNLKKKPYILTCGFDLLQVQPDSSLIP